MLGDNAETGRVWADASRRWHLRQRVATMDADELVRATRARAELRRYRASASSLDTVAAAITRTGLSSLSDAPTARSFGLAVARSDGLDGYPAPAQLDDLAARSFITDDAAGGNVTLHLVDAENAPPNPGGTVHRAALALDLAEVLDTRINRAGNRALDALLAGL